MTFSNRKMDARHFDIDHMILAFLWASQFTFKDDFCQIWQVGTQGLKQGYVGTGWSIEMLSHLS